MTATARPRSAGAVRTATIPLDDGRSLYAMEAGQGAPVVLIHGAMATAEDMALDLFPALSDRYRVVSVDRPGHGRSERKRFEAAPALQAAQIRAGLKALGVERALFVGHSVGGPVALSYARDWPEEVAGLVLLGPLAYPEFRPMEHTYLLPRASPGSGPTLSRAARDTWDPLIVPLMERAMFAPQEIPERWLAGTPQDLMRAPERLTADGEDSADMPSVAMLTASYPLMETPTVILAGDADLVVSPRRHAMRLAAVMPHARLQMLPGLGHMIHHFAVEKIAAAVDELAGR